MSIESFEGITTGKWLVTTEHSDYEFDLDAGTVKRIAGPQANRWHDEDVTYRLAGTPKPYVYVGEGMHLAVDHSDLSVHSTVVKSIVPLWDDAA